MKSLLCAAVDLDRSAKSGKISTTITLPKAERRILKEISTLFEKWAKKAIKKWVKWMWIWIDMLNLVKYLRTITFPKAGRRILKEISTLLER